MKIFLYPDGQPILHKPLLKALKDITDNQRTLKEGKHIYLKLKTGQFVKCEIKVSTLVWIEGRAKPALLYVIGHPQPGFSK